MLQCTLNENGNLPGKTFQVVKTLCKLLGLLLREFVSGKGSYVTMISQQLTERGFIASRKPGGLCEGMLFGRDHEKEQIIDANLCKTGTD